MSYSALVARAYVRPHPNADRLQLATVNGFQVVVGPEVENGQLGIFFNTDGQLSEEFCQVHDLIAYKDPETGEKRGGFFSEKRRVRSQRFRGEKSDGYWVPLSYVDYTGVDMTKLKEGDTFTNLNGREICGKYMTPATLRAMQKGKAAPRTNQFFARHLETDQYKYEKGKIPVGSIIYFTEKLHGTSGRFGFVLDEREVPRQGWRGLVDRLLKRPAPKVVDFDYLHGTRNVILGKWAGKDFYDTDEFRWEKVRPLEGRLHKGEVVYFELVGYTRCGSDAAPIMGSVETSILKDKEISKRYGKQMTYTYGTFPIDETNYCRLYVYRITRVTDNGHAIDLSWPQVKARCRELGLEHVPELAQFPIVYDGVRMTAGDLDWLVESLTDGPSTVDQRHIREGVCLRIETGDKTYFLKSKSFAFGVLEGYIKEREDYVDAEEAA